MNDFGNLIRIEDSPFPIAQLSPEKEAKIKRLQDEKIAESLAKEEIRPVRVIYVPGCGVPSHAPALFGKPFEFWLTPNKSIELPGDVAKELYNYFPKTIFLDDGNGNPVKFPETWKKFKGVTK